MDSHPSTPSEPAPPQDIEGLKAELARAKQELAQFTTVAAHDLQEPLRTLSAHLQLIRERHGGCMSPEDKVEFQGALDDAKHLRGLISDLLAFAQAGAGEPQRVAVDCSALVGRVIGSLGRLTEDKEGLFQVGPLPVLSGEPLLLAQAFRNLIENALLFRRDARWPVGIGAQQRGAEWVFSIKDHGIGIAPAHFEKIFKLFQRLHPREAYPGTGTGLAITKKIIERHGGRIWLESTPDEGSTFFFSLPA